MEGVCRRSPVSWQTPFSLPSASLFAKPADTLIRQTQFSVAALPRELFRQHAPTPFPCRFFVPADDLNSEEGHHLFRVKDSLSSTHQ